MKKKTNGFVRNRILYTALFVLIQAAALVVMFNIFWNALPCFYTICLVLSCVVTLHILNTDQHPAYKLAWIIPILLFPIFGGLLYLSYGTHPVSRKKRRRQEAIAHQIQADLLADSTYAADFLKLPPDAAMQARYILNVTGSAPVSQTETTYLPDGERYFEELLAELKKARRYIFLEYFIIGEGVMWDGVLTILRQKVKEGVDVRVMYDDFGCLLTLPPHYDRVLREMGIKAFVFNPFNSIITSRFNNRDHRKIAVVDGVTAFTGGINLADEYINRKERFGHWKDTGVRLRGKAAWSLTVQFLALWNVSVGDDTPIAAYKPVGASMVVGPEDGFVQPYSDIPLDSEQLGENVYLNMLNRATRYVYITTPYLIIDHDMQTALENAAKCGVDVRIVTPHIPDKKVVFQLTRAGYAPLLRAGVRIFEYTPGFIHAKTMVTDDRFAVVGTINLDYRSLYLHLECAAWMYQSAAVLGVRDDFNRIIAVSQEMTLQNLPKSSWLKKICLGVLHAFAPLL